jgi:hypothetical protein
MIQLTKGMYPKGKYGAGLFGLHFEQMRGKNTMMIKNSGWYNKSGEKLGWGDLSIQDFQRISRELRKDQFFIILSEWDSFWKFVTFHGSGRHSKIIVSRKEKAPGIKYVAEHAAYVIALNKLYKVDHFGELKKKTLKEGDLKFNVLGIEALKILMTKIIK